MGKRTLSAAGFTLIEMMVVVVILGVVTAQLFTVFANQKRVFTSNDRALDVQESARLTLDMISFDARMAGFMVPPRAAVASIDGGKDHADRLCLSSNGFVPPMNQPAPGLEGQIDVYDGLPVSAVSALGVVEIPLLDVDGDGNPDLVAGQGVIVASHTKSYCARILSINIPGPGKWDLTFDVPAGENAFNYLGADVTDMVVVPANIYELNEKTMELRRNTLLLASQVEDFQVEFWLDNPGVSDGAVRAVTAGVGVDEGDSEFPVNDLNNPDPPAGPTVANNDAIRRVRVSLTARTVREEQINAASGHLQGSRPKLANRDGDPTPDTFRRRSFSASILPRNINIGMDLTQS
ncbi:MAG TPA: prepilin-type N-terminal cleavage/methylation domain-containing protein [Myxococcota bacterium]|nr:prepilin-type N-terminal cleavage/methylation domain-containing protein [Myxococcota bacterium]